MATRCIRSNSAIRPLAEEYEMLDRNPEGAHMRGLWSDLNFLSETGSSQFNSLLKNTQFGDLHGHGWMFRKVFKRDRKGNLLDSAGQSGRSK